MKLILVAFSAAVLAASGWVGSLSQAFADDSNQPYIDQLKSKLPPVQSSEGYTESIKGQLAPESSEGYTERLKQSLGQGNSSQGYTDQIRQTLAPKSEGGAIEAVKEGHSELKLKKSLDIHSAIGFRVGMGVSRSITATPQVSAGGNFNTIYGNSWAPDVALYYEYQFLRDERWGSLGVFGMGSLAYFTGSGSFETPINFAGTGQNVTTSQTSLRFFEVPTVAGISYRMNLFKYVRPYVMLGPSLIGGSESRSDGISAHYALSEGYWGAGGIAILIDALSRSQDWDRYEAFSIKHTYFTLEYNKLTTLQSSPIIYDTSGAYAGFTFEF